MSDEPKTVELPAALVERVETRLPRTEFDSADGYVAFVVAEVLSSVESATDDHGDGDGDDRAVDEAEVRDRLESLGYLDS